MPSMQLAAQVQSSNPEKHPSDTIGKGYHPCFLIVHASPQAPVRVQFCGNTVDIGLHDEGIQGGEVLTRESPSFRRAFWSPQIENLSLIYVSKNLQSSQRTKGKR
jgi:hypothetical protein